MLTYKTIIQKSSFWAIKPCVLKITVKHKKNVKNMWAISNDINMTVININLSKYFIDN